MICVSLFFKWSSQDGVLFCCCFGRFFFKGEIYLKFWRAVNNKCTRLCSDAPEHSGFPTANPFNRFMNSLLHFCHCYTFRPMTFWMHGNANSAKIHTAYSHNNNSWHFQQHAIRFNCDLRLKVSKSSNFIPFFFLSLFLDVRLFLFYW